MFLADSLPVRLALSVTRQHMSTPLFIRGAKVCTDPASANGRVWFLTAYVEETGADEKLCVGLKVLRLTTQEPPRAMSCYIRLKSSEGQYTVLAKALNVRDVDDLQLFRSFRFSVRSFTIFANIFSNLNCANSRRSWPMRSTGLTAGLTCTQTLRQRRTMVSSCKSKVKTCLTKHCNFALCHSTLV